MEKDKNLIQPLPNMNFCNITSTFSGIGSIILDINSIILSAIDQYSLDLEQCPFQTIYLHFQYITQNLKQYQLKDIVYFYEFTGNPYFDLAIIMINDGTFLEYDKIKDSIENTRIALALCYYKRSKLINYLSSSGLYIGLIDALIFEIPFVFTLVYTPVEIIDPNLIYTCLKVKEELIDESTQDFIKKYNFDISKNNYEFFNFSEDWIYDNTNNSKISNNSDSTNIDNKKIDKEFVNSLLNHCLKNNKILFFDGRILKGLRSIKSKIDENEIDRSILEIKSSKPWSGMDLDLISAPIPERISMKHLANIRKSAMSLYDGKFHFNTIVKETTQKPTKVSAKMLKIIQENEERMRSEKEKTDNIWLRNFYSNYSKLPNLKAKKSMLEKIKINNEYINKRLLLLKIELYSEIWNLEKMNEQVDEKKLVPLYLSCLDFIDKYVKKDEDNFNNKNENNVNKKDANKKEINNNFSKDELEFVITKLIEANFESTACEILEKIGIELNVPLSPNAKSSPSDIDLYFQLKYAGDHLKRTLGTRKDRRVPFDPDKWQVDLLNAVDANKSAIVAAPTSSGKTFICFYAIEKILRSSDKDVVVFCLPTKALVNQVSADIYARFTPKNIKTSLQGTLMADKSNEPFNCQVLITVPAMLESLLVSKDCSNIKYIIIDEVHKINDMSLGLKIERIIHLAKCPLLLLSATLGNLDGFYSWFKNIESSKGRECELVYHGERYCELKSYVYTEKKFVEEENNENENLGEIPIKPALVSLNGMFPYSFSHLKKFGFGNDLHFLPEELLNIYLYIYMILDPQNKKLIKNLAPKKFFKSNIICKADIREYQNHLLSTFRNWVSNGILGESQVQEIHNLLTAESHDAFNFDSSENYISENIMKLLNTLKDSDMLPVIVFNTDRDFVTRLARLVYEKLEKADIIKKKDKALEALKKEAKRTRDEEKSNSSWIEESIVAEQMIEPDKRNIKFTFLDPATKLTDYDIKNEFSDIKDVPKDILDMAYRGIGIHHSAMNRKYRSAVEILFRKKHIRVLFATETLALGINMPCRTVVFAGDSLQLDPMNYKQMSGRAGRRGYDTLGNVVFFGIPKHRVQNLMVSMLPEIQGAYTYSNTSLVSFNIEDSIINFPLLMANKTKLMNSSKKDINCLDSDDKSLLTNLENLNINLNNTNNDFDNNVNNNNDITDINNINATLSVLDTKESRKHLVEYQKSIYSTIFPSNYLWDLFISNREFDPAIFVFAALFENNKIDWAPKEFMNLISHLFEVRPAHPEFEYSLKPLSPEIDQYISQINNIYLQDVNKFYTPALKILQNQTNKPLLHLKSFLYTLKTNKNSYIFDFYCHGSSYKIRKYNLILEGELWQSLYNIQTFFNSFIKLLETYYGSQDERLKRLRMIFKEFNDKFEEIFA